MPPRPSSFGPARVVLAAAVLSAFCLFSGSARAAEVGINSDITWGISSASISQEVGLTRQAGVPWVRATIDLSGAEYYGPQLNPGYLNGIDAAVQAARAAGENVLLELDRAPYWASADPAKYTDASGLHWNPYWQYTSPQVYAQVVSDVVRHYATMGVHAYEVWNEPNNPTFWPSGVNAAAYAGLLKAAYPAIKAADPSAAVVMGGLENEASYSYLQGMYDAGARGYYDVANFHIYPSGDPTQCVNGSDGRPSVNSFCLLDGLRAEMAANGDDVPAWVTELGWSTCTQGWCVTPQQQAAYVTSAYQLLSTSRYAWVQKAFVYQMRDLYMDTSNASWGSSLGMMGRDFSPKPAFYALRAAAAGAGTTTSGGGGGGSPWGTGSPPAVAPAVTLTSPSSGALIGSSISAVATASDPVGITKVVFSVDHAETTTDSSAPYRAALSARRLSTGAHTVTVTAYDPAGRSTSSSATVYKGGVVLAGSASVSADVMRVSLRVRGAHSRRRVISAAGKVSVVRRPPTGGVVLVLQRWTSQGWRAVPRAGVRRRIYIAHAAITRAQRRVVGWHTVRRVRLRLRHDRYIAHLHLARGVWRLWASLGGARSTTRVLRIGPQAVRQ